MGTLTKNLFLNPLVRVAATGLWLAASGPLARSAETNAAATASPAATNATPAANTNAASSAPTNAAPASAAAPPTAAVAAKSAPAPAAVAAASPAPGTSKTDYVAFKIINDRNIFNPNRTSRSAAPVVVAEKPKVVKVEAFALLGTMSYDKGSVAFFDGTSSSYKKAFKPAETIANYKIKEIAQSGVKLEADGKEVELRVGMQMRRQDEGEWQIGAKTESFSGGSRSSSGDSGRSSRSSTREGGEASSPAPASASDSGSSGGASDLLKRLMEQRAKELNK